MNGTTKVAEVSKIIVDPETHQFSIVTFKREMPYTRRPAPRNRAMNIIYRAVIPKNCRIAKKSPQRSFTRLEIDESKYSVALPEGSKFPDSVVVRVSVLFQKTPTDLDAQAVRAAVIDVLRNSYWKYNFNYRTPRFKFDISKNDSSMLYDLCGYINSRLIRVHVDFLPCSLSLNDSRLKAFG